ncbi:hypothetical protein [Nocardia sp. NPDC127526]|uniref:hypothetical protein n=1 Tax=Nocardia sp. NPDC127526 TaxID=3345393 RepID=UPI00362BC7A2
MVEFVRVGDEVLALGSVPGAEGRAPAAWVTGDGSEWRAVGVEPKSGYGFVAELISAGVGERIVVLGQAFGGAHSNPRMTVWSGGVGGLVEHPQVVEMFGGPRAIAVSGAAALGGVDLLVGGWGGPQGYGAAVWTSRDGATWARRADDPALASAVGEQTGAADVTTGPEGFVVVGHTLRDGAPRPLEWVSGDGFGWERRELGGVGVLATRVGCGSAGCTVFGQTTGTPAQIMCWPGVGAVAVGGPTASTVDVLQVLARDARAVTAFKLDGVVHLASTASNCTDWQEISMPIAAFRARMVELPGGGLLLATTEDEASRLWLRAPRR